MYDWLKLLSDPRFLKMLENSRDYQENLAAKILKENPLNPWEPCPKGPKANEVLCKQVKY